MFLRITKYNPAYRNEKGHYLKDEWTAPCDIGKEFEGVELTLEKYLEVEQAHTDAILILMRNLNVGSFKVIQLMKVGYEDLAGERNAELKKFYDALHGDQTIGIDQIPSVVKLFKRELIGGKLFSEELEIHFGYDYYMYAVSKDQSEKSVAEINESGLFAEDFRSPYIDEDE